ncbi:MAG: DUF2066 domain-containing protein [Alphaproteobacteria bacterium]|nr:DUF2066 domain-containing protein [Alphaproteobacteria bacterium]
MKTYAMKALGAVLAIVVGAWCNLPQAALAAGPVETSIFAVQGVDVDVTSTDAAAAKNQALMDVQVKAFFTLAERLGSPELAQDLAEKMGPKDIAPFLKSLSIEEETSAPGRYIGKFTVRFLPEKTRKFYAGYGINLPATQADPILVLPVWRGKEANQIWDDNIWRKAWLALRAEQGLVPIIVPLGDLEDTETIDAEATLLKDPIKLEAIRRRYGAPSLLIAQAQEAEGGGLHAFIEGETTFGKLTFNKVFTSEDASLESSAMQAVQTFQAQLVKAYKASADKAAAAAAAADAEKNANRKQAISVSVPFSSPTEWNRIRSRILATPNVVAVDVSTLSIEGAVIRLVFTNSMPRLQDNMEKVGLRLAQYGSTWVIQPL